MRFNKVYIEITNNCNLNCSFCAKSTRIKKFMSVNDFHRVVDKIKKYTKNIYLHVQGEPLLHPELDSILTITDECNLNVRITTNGTLLLNKLDILLKHHIKQINISLHSENNMPNYLENIFKCSELLRKQTVVIYRLWVLNDLTFSNKEEQTINKIIDNYKLSTEIVDKIYHDKNIKLADNLYLDKDNEFIWPIDSLKKESHNSDEGYCLGIRKQLAILVNGTVVPCCLDNEGVINLGNIFKTSLEEIIESELFMKIDNGFLNGQVVHKLCQSCLYRTRFKNRH